MCSIRAAQLVILACALTGCYTLQPVGETRPEPGMRVAFHLSDAGRVALGGSIGPEIDQIEGRLVGGENGEYVMAVLGVRFIDGGEQTWTGERVNIKSEHVARTFERRFSRGRTIALTTTLIGAAALITFGSDLVGLGREERPRPPRDPDPTELIGRRP